MTYRVRSYRTGKGGYATEIPSSKGSTWQVTTEGAEDILFFTPEEFNRIFAPMGTVTKFPLPSWMLPEEKKKVEQGSLFGETK